MARKLTQRLWPLIAAALLTSAALATPAFAALDDDLPGLPIDFTATTLAQDGALDPVSDRRDVYALFLFAGEELTVSFTAAPDTNYRFSVYGPQVTDLEADPPMMSIGSGDSSEKTLPVWSTGYYFLVPTVPDDLSSVPGTYSVSLGMSTQAADAYITPPRTTAFGESVDITAEVFSARDLSGSPAWDGEMKVYFSANGLTGWVPLDNYGAWSSPLTFTSLPNTEKTYYMVTFNSSGGYTQTSSITYLTTKASLSAPKGSRYGTRSYRLYGYLEPWHAPGSNVAQIKLWRLVNGSYRYYGTKWAKAYDYTSPTTGDVYTKYSYSLRFPYSGKWRMQAVHSDSGHLSTTTGYSYLSVN